MARERRQDTQAQIDRLVQRHGELSQLVAELDGRMFLTAREQMLVAHLKKEKLATKDALFDLRKVV